MLTDVVASSEEEVPPGPSSPDEGEAASFEAIYERYGARVLNLAYRMTGNEEVARDLAQDVWVRVFERLNTFEARSDLFTWIYRITVNHALNHMKRERRVRWLDLLDRSVGEVLREEDVDPAYRERREAPRADARLEADERAVRLWQAIQSLNPKYRVPLVLFHYEELSYQQVADAMGLSMAAVEARIHRARRKLAEALGPLLDAL
jgi:RNA polymerase sigma-70 factor (ECF subfamily)